MELYQLNLNRQNKTSKTSRAQVISESNRNMSRHKQIELMISQYAKQQQQNKAKEQVLPYLQQTSPLFSNQKLNQVASKTNQNAPSYQTQKINFNGNTLYSLKSKKSSSYNSNSFHEEIIESLGQDNGSQDLQRDLPKKKIHSKANKQQQLQNQQSNSRQDINNQFEYSPNAGQYLSKTQNNQTLPFKYQYVIKPNSPGFDTSKTDLILKIIMKGRNSQQEDEVPGPGHYNLKSQFGTDYSYLGHKRFQSQLDEYPYSSMGSENFLFKYNQTYREPTFGMSYQQIKQQYFREYDRELKGKHSPGPAFYEVSPQDFNIKRHQHKSMPREKRECPIVNKTGNADNIGPFNYNKDVTMFNKRNSTTYYGSRAERNLDFRKMGLKHGGLIRKGLIF